jgi:hypothetical protein
VPQEVLSGKRDKPSCTKAGSRRGETGSNTGSRGCVEMQQWVEDQFPDEVLLEHAAAALVVAMRALEGP